MSTAPSYMDRRQFIELTAAGSAAFSLPGMAWGAAYPAAALHGLARPALLTLLGDEHVVRALGFRYRQQAPGERRAKALQAALLDGAPLPGRPGPELEAYLQRRVRDDFEAGRTVLLDGWVLARTEARQCALFSLLYP